MPLKILDFLKVKTAKTTDGSIPADTTDMMRRAADALQGGELARAIQLYDRVIMGQHDHAEALYKRANAFNAMGHGEAALADYDRAVSLDPLYANAWCNRGYVLERLGRWDEALASYDRALVLNPGDHLAHSNRGSVLKKLERLEEALASYDRAIALKAGYVEAYFYRGNVLHALRRYEAAVASFEKAIEFTPLDLQPYLAHFGRAFALVELKRLTEALASFDQAIACKGDYVEAYIHRGNILHELRQYHSAIESFDQAIARQPSDRLAFDAHCGRGFALKELNRFEDALASYAAAIALIDDDVETYMNCGGLLQECGRHDAAVAMYEKAITLKSDYVEAFQGRGFALLGCRKHEAAIASFDQALALDPNQKYLLGFRRYVQMQVCDWKDLTPYLGQLIEGLHKRQPVSAPFPVLALLDSAPLHRLAAEVWMREECPPDDALGAIPHRPRSDKIRVGYFSSDFRIHPVSLLTAELFETHDRHRFEITAFAFGPAAEDAMRTRLERTFDRFVDVRAQSDREVALLAREIGIDIAVDLGGFTEHARTKIFALRAAPIQMSYIGYLGTLGAPFMDYLVADATIIPADARQHYAEKILYLPSYQVNDSQRSAAERQFTRGELGLPPEGFVFACFNTSYKIMPSMFTVWMRILTRVESSCLFLCAGNAVAERNLVKEAERCGVDSRRIVFGGHLALPEYLARFRTMDLFLDTLPYNAGTTASDALWAGLPVLTCAGQAFAGRVAASLLTALELPELITSTMAQYEDLAVRLATNPARMAELRDTLARNRLTAPLFDTARFARHLESAYTRVYERYHANLPPDHIDPPSP